MFISHLNHNVRKQLWIFANIHAEKIPINWTLKNALPNKIIQKHPFFKFSLFISFSKMTALVPQVYSGDPSCYLLPPADPNAFTYTGTWTTHNYAWLASGVCAAISSILTTYLIIQHLRNYNSPSIQKQIIRIIMMVLIYGIDSFLSFRFYRWGVYIDLIRDCYEAFVIYVFVVLCVELM